MSLWLVFALMTAAAVFAVLWPLSRRGKRPGGSDVVVYRDQLDEIARDRAAGLIGEAEAEAARIEVSRRLIAAADAAPPEPAASDTAPLWRRRATALAALLLLPIGAAALYLTLGSPQMPGEPLAARLREIHQDDSIASLVSRVEAHLEREPNDARGYEVLAPVYLRLGRFADAVAARRKLLALAGETAGRQADLGEALTAAANGIVIADAKSAFERALALDANALKAKFFVGLAAEQDGDKAKAASIWRGMLKQAPPGAPWIAPVSEALVRVGGTPPPVAAAPGPGTADVAAAGSMSEQDRGAMVRGMVAQLAERLKQNGSDVDGWLQLVRSYRVLGENDKAQAAVADAQRALAADPEKLKKFTEGAEGTAVAAPPAPPVAAAPGPSAADVAAAAGMNAQDRSDMIRGMVGKLADRLKQNGDDVEGWQRLLRAYMVLGERDKAHAAATDAKRALASNPDKLRQIEDMIKNLGLEG